MSVAKKYGMTNLLQGHEEWNQYWFDLTIKGWRKIGNRLLRQWMECNQKDYFEQRIRFLQEPLSSPSRIKYEYINCCYLLNLYHDAHFQECYKMKINYKKRQIITFLKKEEYESEEYLDLLPPMRFCEAENDKSRRYLCSESPEYRKGITLDHPFMIWLTKNVFLMNKYYQRQFRQIIDSLRYSDATDIISEINAIRQQLISLPEHHGVDVYNFPQLSSDDFWYIEDDSETSI